MVVGNASAGNLRLKPQKFSHHYHYTDNPNPVNKISQSLNQSLYENHLKKV